MIGGMQKHVEVDEPEEDNMAALMQSGEWAGVPQDNDDLAEGMSIEESDGDDEAEAEAADEAESAADAEEVSALLPGLARPRRFVAQNTPWETTVRRGAQRGGEGG